MHLLGRDIIDERTPRFTGLGGRHIDDIHHCSNTRDGIQPLGVPTTHAAGRCRTTRSRSPMATRPASYETGSEQASDLADLPSHIRAEILYPESGGGARPGCKPRARPDLTNHRLPFDASSASMARQSYAEPWLGAARRGCSRATARKHRYGLDVLSSEMRNLTRCTRMQKIKTIPDKFTTSSE